jgi:hypothetical protein
MGGDDTRPWDLVVVVPGIGGSVLERDGTDVWDLDARTVLGHLWNRAKAIESLTLPLDLGDEAPNDVAATRLVDGMTLVPGIWEPIAGYRNLIRFLEETVGLQTIRDNKADSADAGNLLCFAYDWRLSNRHSANRLKVEVERALKRRNSLQSPGGRGVALICHSMGGLIARYFLDVLAPDAPVELLITLGTPHRGALKALDVLSNGVPHLYGRARKRLTAFVRSLPSVHQLLPEYACIDAGEAEPEWFDAATCGLDSAMASDAKKFHVEIDDADQTRGSREWWVGVYQTTKLTASMSSAGSVTSMTTYRGQPHGMAGDGTVPHFAAVPKGINVSDRRRRSFTQGHGALIAAEHVWAELALVLGAETAFRSKPPAPPPVAIEVPEAIPADDGITFDVQAPGATMLTVHVRLVGGGTLDGQIFRGDGHFIGTIAHLGPGVHQLMFVIPPSFAHPTPIPPVIRTVQVVTAEPGGDDV